jgi:uncharacterized protein YndB with AHSA1/START domain
MTMRTPFAALAAVALGCGSASHPHKDPAMSPPVETHDLVITRAFDAPIEQVWAAWTDAEQVKRWWGPTGFTVPVARIDFRVGGTSLVAMRAPKEYGGQDITTPGPTLHRPAPAHRVVLMPTA